MSWTIKLIMAVLLTSITGSVEVILWYAFSKILERLGCTRLIYSSLMIIMLLWLLPISYIYLYIKNMNFENGGGLLFVQTEKIMLLCEALALLWGIVVTVSIYKYVRSNRKLQKTVADAYECDYAQNQMFNSLCKELNIKNKKLKIQKSDYAIVPICLGILNPRIIIPTREYKENELRTVLLHELNHYKHKDILIKHLAFVITSLNCFNPIAYFMKRKLDFWSECNCDLNVVRYTNERKKYFEYILSVLDTNVRGNNLASNLVLRKSDLELRIIQMKRSQKMTNKKKIITIVCAICMIATGIATFATTTYAAEKSYIKAYDATVVDVSEDECEIFSEELVDSDFSVYEEEEEVIAMGRGNSSYSFNWDVPPSSSKRSSGFVASTGNVITVGGLIVPNGVQVRIGIIQPNGVRRYILINGGFGHSFTVTQNGTHYVYAQNMSSTKSVEVDGVYSKQ